MASDPYGSEFAASRVEDIASSVVDLHLPEERLRIGDLLEAFPQPRETKVQKLLDGLGTLWRQNPSEKVVIRSEEHTSELQSLMRISYAVFCLKKKKHKS